MPRSSFGQRNSSVRRRLIIRTGEPLVGWTHCSTAAADGSPTQHLSNGVEKKLLDRRAAPERLESQTPTITR